MATYTLKRKTYSDGEGMSTGKKVALGIGATLGTAALGFAGARRGFLGANAALKSNQAWMKAGKALGSKGMVINGAKKWGNTMAKQAGEKAGSEAAYGFQKQAVTKYAGADTANAMSRMNLANSTKKAAKANFTDSEGNIFR